MKNNIFLFSDHNTVIGTNGTYAIGFELELAEKYTLGSDDYAILNEGWVRALKDLPTNSLVVKQDIFLKKEFDTSNYKNDNYLQKSTKEHFSKRPYLNHKCYLFYVLPDGDTFSTKISNPFKRLNRKKFEKFDNAQNNFNTSVEQSVNFLKGIKINSGRALKVRELEQEEMLGYYEYYFNNFQDEYVTDKSVKGSYIQIGNKYLGAVCTRDEESFPERINKIIADQDFSSAKYKFYQNYGDLFGFNLDFDHIFNQIIFFEDNTQQLDKLRRTNDLLKKSAKFDPNNAVNDQKTEALIYEIANNTEGERIIKGHINVLFLADDPKELSNHLNKVVEKFKGIDVKPRQPTGNFLNSLYTNSFYLFAQYLSERQLFYGNLSTASLFINNCTKYKEDKTGIILNSRLSNVPVIVDIWDEKKNYMNARNFMVLANTGGGKSVLANHIFRQYYEDDAKIIIVDLGGSYRKLLALYPNDTLYISYKDGEPIGLNPFDLQGEKITTTKIEDLVEFIITHYKRGEESISEIEKTSLRKIVENYYFNGGEPSFKAFIKTVRDNKATILDSLNISQDFFNLEMFLHLLSEFEDGGTYEFLYKDENNSNLNKIRDKKIIVFELDEVKDNELLLSIMLQLISSAINEVIWKDKNRKGFVFFDEFAKQLHFKGVLNKIAFFFQAIRKQNGSVGIVLQSISQLPESNISNSIIENTQVVYVIDAKDYKYVQSRLNLSDHAYNQMVSLSSDFAGERPFSEIFLMRGQHHQVYRLELPKKVLLAYDTEGQKNVALMQLYDETQDMEQAIDKYLQNN